MVDTDVVVSVTGVKHGTVGGPGKGGTVRNSLVLAGRGEVALDLVDHDLELKIPDLDARLGGGNEPETVGGEDHGVDDVTSLEGVKALALTEVPKHSSSVLTTRGTEGAIGRDTHGVQVTSVTGKVGAKLKVAERPDLDKLVPAGRHDGRSGLLVRGEAHAGNPLGVTILLDGVLALTKGVPELDGAVTRTGHDLTVVGRERHGKHVLGVTLELLGALTRLDLPKAEGSVPGAGKGELTVGGKHDVGDKVVVTAKGTTGETVVTLLTGKGPDNDGLVTGTGKDHVRILGGGGNGGDPVAVASKNTLKGNNWYLISHLKISKV